MKAKITKSLLKSLEPKEKPYEVKDTETTGFHVRVYPTGKISYYYAYRNPEGRRHRILIGNVTALTLQQARDTVTRHAVDVADGIDVQAEKKAQRSYNDKVNGLTLSGFLDHQYAPWITSHTKSGEATLKRIRTSFKPFLDKPLPDLTLEVLEKWRIQQNQKGLKPSTINRHISALSGAMSKAVQWKLIPEHPFKGLGNLKVDKKPIVRYLSEDENKRLMAALAERDQSLKVARERGNAHRAERGYPLLPVLMNSAFADRMTPMVILSLKTGLRRGEVFDLEWKHVNFDQRLIVVVGDNAKSGQTRYIPMSQIVYDTLKVWYAQAPQPHGRVFPADDGSRLDNVRKSWASILKLAGISSFRWHDMRHDFASQLVMRGVPLNTVRELCGHAEFETTLRYADLSTAHKADAVALLDY